MNEEHWTQEEKLLRALALMCQRYIPASGREIAWRVGARGEGPDIFHNFMSAGEHAVEVLLEYGWLEEFDNGWRWTDKAIRMLPDYDFP